MSQYDWMFDLKINVGYCDIFHGPVILACILKTNVWTSYFGIISQYDTPFDLKINVGHCDLYFMFQWFCLIFLGLFDIWTP